MHMFNLDHLPDKNFSQVGSHITDQHTNQNKPRKGIVVAVTPSLYQCDVKMFDIVDNFGRPVVVKGVSVGTERGGDGWGEVNLPWIGQMVDIEFHSGISSSTSTAVIKKRYYTDAHKPPSHPLISDRQHMKGYFYQSPGGSFSFEHADGQTTRFQMKPSNGEGAKANDRATGVATSAVESRMDKSAASAAAAAEAFQRVGDEGVMIGEAVSKLTALTGLLT